MRRSSSAVGVAAVMTVAAAYLAAPAWAAFSNVQQGCRSGGSGNACTQLQKDANAYRARGATDPNPGYGMYLRDANLVAIFTDSFGEHYNTLRTVTGGNSMSYQAVVTSGYTHSYGCASFYSYMRFSTASGTYTVSTPQTGQSCLV